MSSLSVANSIGAKLEKGDGLGDEWEMGRLAIMVWDWVGRVIWEVSCTVDGVSTPIICH